LLVSSSLSLLSSFLKKSSTATGAQSRTWCFTLNNPHESYPSENEFKLAIGAYTPTAYMFQLERGEEETPHYQGCFKLKSPQRWSTVVKYIPRWHLEPCRDWAASLIYCSKEDTRIKGPWFAGCEVPTPPEPKYTFALDELRPWQQKVIDLIVQPPDNRSIHWFFDPVGKMGKTVLAKHICCNYNAIFVQGKAADIKSAIAVMEKKPRIVLFGLPRSSEDFVSYDAIESCKDGIFFSGKYESGMCVFAPPHILIFANFKPDLSKLSSDRWNVIELSAAPPFSAYSEVMNEDTAISAAISSAVAPAAPAQGLEHTIASGAAWESIP
jgi:hypothetical protein